MTQELGDIHFKERPVSTHAGTYMPLTPTFVIQRQMSLFEFETNVVT